MSILLNTVGTYTVQYQPAGLNNSVSGYTPQQIKDELAQQYQELRNATININNGVITFSLPSGQKNG